MKKIIILMIPVCTLSLITKAQNTFPQKGKVGIFTTTPNKSAALDIDTTGLGLLIPRMTKAQRDAIASPATSLLIYQKDNTPGYYYYNGSAWTAISSKGANTALSNLKSPTAVNQSLIPGTNTLNLGSSNKAWQKIFVSDGLYYKTSRIFHADSMNTAVGASALGLNTTGIINTALGVDALHFNTTGSLNTALGKSALYANTSGTANTAIGAAAMYQNTTGNFNTASGLFALTSNTSGSNNVAMGDNAMYSNTTGNSNVAMGSKALYRNKVQSGLIAIGDSTLFNDTTGYSNIAIGHQSMLNNISGYKNISIGSWALRNLTSGSSNVAIGESALYENIDGVENVAIGYSAMEHSTHGGNNVAIGSATLRYNTGSYNTAVGNNAMDNNATGYSNTALGSGTDVGSSNHNATAIGFGAIASSSNMIRIGNIEITSIGGQVGWTTFSDGLYNKNIKENVPGLGFINSLRPVTYTVDVTGLHNYYQKKTGRDLINDSSIDEKTKFFMKESIRKEENVIHSGFIAQEVETAANKFNYDFSGVDKPEDKNNLYGLRYDEFVVPLVKAVQELSKEKEELETKLDKIEAMLAKTNAASNASNKKLNSVLISSKLYQNQPNPANYNTTIKYSIPDNILEAAIKVTNAKGQQIKLFNLSSGNGQVVLQTNDLSGGTYFYSLLINNKTIETKKLIVAK